jgi:ribosomal protein S18 acetylase RimI-like enzyme
VRVQIRDATVDEISALEALQLRASLVAPEYRTQLLAHPELIHLPLDDVTERRTRVAVLGERLAGFSVVRPVDDASCELDGLFVEPDLMGRGIGRELVVDVARSMQAQGIQHIDVTSNPAAVGFYARLGFVQGADATTLFGPAPRMRLDLPLPSGS